MFRPSHHTIHSLRPRCISPIPSTRCITTPQIQYHYSTLISPLRIGKNKVKGEKVKVIFSGIQPTGIPHLGNYLGALSQWVHLQNTESRDTKLLFSIVDLHALTNRVEGSQLLRWKRETAAVLLAVGIRPERSTIFVQSELQATDRLMWILSCTASMGYLERMTQWKSKMSLPDDALINQQSKLKLGLFSYPVLQAADILLMGATHVPVGEDQAQHLEFARECVTNFNHAFGKPILTSPQTILSPAKRIKSLLDPTKKMSKSDPNPSSRILITDSPSEIERKIKGALTDSENNISYDPINRPGVANLLTILFHFLPQNRVHQTAVRNRYFRMDRNRVIPRLLPIDQITQTQNQEQEQIQDQDEKQGIKAIKTVEELGKYYEDKGIGLGEFKKEVTEYLIEGLKDVRENYTRIMAEDEGRYLDSVILRGKQSARSRAAWHIQIIEKGLGLGW